MKIAAAHIQMQSSHLSMQHFESSERLEMWVGERPGNPAAAAPGAPGSARVALSEAARAALDAEQAGATEAADTEAADTADPRLRLLKSMIEFLTGKAVRVFDSSELTRNRLQVDMPGASQAAPAHGANGRAGFGVAYDYQATYAEFEQVSFQASGMVRTADGREIAFNVAFEMQRSYFESSSISLRAGDARLKDPLILDFGGPAGALSDLRFRFDLDADGTPDAVPLPGGSGFLAFDRNANGQIDDGRELFGPLSGDGFAELAALDSDGNGWIDEADAAFASLYVWRPAADGPGVLQTLAEAGIGALYLGRVATPFSVRDAANDTLGLMRASSIYVREDGSAGSISQVDLSV